MSEKSKTIRDFLFPGRPRFCRLKKTRNRRYPHLSGIIGDTSGESGTFIFSRHIPDFCNDRWSSWTNLFKFVLSGTLAMDSAHYQYSKLLHFSPPIIHKCGIETVIWTSPHFGHPHSQNPCDTGIPCNPNPNPKRQGNMRRGCPYH